MIIYRNARKKTYIEIIHEEIPYPGSRAEYILLREKFQALDETPKFSSQNALRNMMFLKSVKSFKDLNCSFCGKPNLVIYDFISKKNYDDMATTDHFLPSSRGGTSNIDNLVVSCWKCNNIKRNHIFPLESLEFLCSIATIDEIKKSFGVNYPDDIAYLNFRLNLTKKYMTSEQKKNYSENTRMKKICLA